MKFRLNECKVIKNWYDNMFISMDFDYILLCMGVVLIIVEGLRYKFGFEILVIFSLYMYFNCWIEC